MARTSRKQAFFVPETKNSAIKIALYVRLSNEDNGGKGKDSINNQLELLLDFSKQLEDAEIVETYIDNGHTGTDFEAFINNLKEIDEPTVVFMIGDHYPSLKGENSVYDQLGMNGDNCGVLYEQPFIVWSNYDLDYSGMPQ